MAPPPFPRASLELDYPLYALDFDLEDSNRLFVGGGGGASRTGVGNKITAVETVSQEELRVAGELELSRDEDSVMSLAAGPHKGRTTYLYAGVNSSPDSIAKGKNEHLRTLAVEQAKSQQAQQSTGDAKKIDCKVSEAARRGLFGNPDADTYQRLLRVAGPVGVAATAMGKTHQLAIFDAAGATPKPRGVLELPREAEDMDIMQTGENEFQVAFCYKYELHLVHVGKETTGPELVYTMPDDVTERPVFRSIRYLSSKFILAAANLPKRSGVVLYGFRLPAPGSDDKARLSVTARIPRKISATALAAINLAPPASPWAPLGETQFIVAVAGHDSSLSLYTLEHKSSGTIELLANMWPFANLTDVHGTDNITGIAFSRFAAPKNHARQQFVKLASISLQKTVAVHSIPLQKHDDKTPRNRNAPPRPARYVVALKSRGPSNGRVMTVLALIVVIMATVGQIILEVNGSSPPVLQAHKFVPLEWQGTVYPHKAPAGKKAFLADQFLAKLSGGDAAKPMTGETLVVFEGGDVVPDTDAAAAAAGEEDATKQIQLDVHDEAVHGPGKTWDELSVEQQKAWKGRLKEAGAWTHNMGESVFQGVLFGELAGAVGRAVGG